MRGGAGHDGRMLPIGAPGFEPGTSPTRTVRATRLRHALVAEEEIGVLPAVALRRRRLGPVEAELLGTFADRVMAVEKLHVARPRVPVDESRDRREEVLAAAGALQVVEDLNGDRGV